MWQTQLFGSPVCTMPLAGTASEGCGGAKSSHCCLDGRRGRIIRELRERRPIAGGWARIPHRCRIRAGLTSRPRLAADVFWPFSGAGRRSKRVGAGSIRQPFHANDSATKGKNWGDHLPNCALDRFGLDRAGAGMHPVGSSVSPWTVIRGWIQLPDSGLQQGLTAFTQRDRSVRLSGVGSDGVRCASCSNADGRSA